MLRILWLPIILTLLYSANTFAQMLPQYTDSRLVEMPYKNSGGERGTTFFRYGRDNKLFSTVWKLIDGSRCSINYHIYDDQGLEKEKIREFSDGLTSSEKYFYDEKGRRIKEIFKRSDGVGGTGRFAWDSQDRLVSAQCDKFKGWFTGLITYEYDGDRKISAKIEKGDKVIGSISYRYDKEGRLILENWDFNGRWDQTFNYVYEPVPEKIYGFSSPFVAMNPSYRVVEENYDFNNESGGPSRYRYDGEGKLVEKTYEMTDGLKTVTTYVYNGKGNLVSSHREYSTGLTADFTYSFDSSGWLTERRFKRSDGAEGLERYEWERPGRLSKAVYRNMDFWLNGKISFNHDKWGRLASGFFKGENGFDAELVFETDDHANVLKMHWKFRFGKTQTYFFKYHPICRNLVSKDID